jgi:hypothetical protein
MKDFESGKHSLWWRAAQVRTICGARAADNSRDERLDDCRVNSFYMLHKMQMQEADRDLAQHQLLKRIVQAQ